VDEAWLRPTTVLPYTGYYVASQKIGNCLSPFSTRRRSLEHG
jgi:hypothetical protein